VNLGSCPKCGSSNFREDGRCRPCAARRKAAWRAANPDKVQAADRRKNYGITKGQFDALFTAQHGVCAICKEGEANSVDHCHATGRIRALLCRACNAGLGLLGENSERLLAAAEYLRSFKQL